MNNKVRILNFTVKSLCTIFLVGFVSLLSAQIPNYVPLSGLQGFWPFTGNANDISGNGNNGTVNGATLTFDRFGTPGSAYDFNGISSYISTNYGGILGSAPRAVSFWAKTTTSGNSMAAVAWGGNSQASRFYCGFNFLSPGVTIDGAYGALTYSPVTPAHNNQWHHYVFQFSNPGLTQVSIYQDGVLLNQMIQSYNPTNILNTLPTFNVHFGRIIYPPSPDFFGGQLDEIGIWNRTLSNCEIQALYTGSLVSGIGVTSTKTLVCVGESVTLTASGGSNYVWNNNTNGPTVVVNPTITTTYSVTSASGTSCSAFATIQIVVQQPTINSSASKTLLCAGESATLSATGGQSYLWNNNQTGSTIVVTPTSTSNYVVTSTDSQGCSTSKTITLMVDPAVVNVTASKTIVCSGEPVVLGASGATTYSWSNSATGPIVLISPQATTLYVVTGTSTLGCLSSASVAIQVEPCTLIDEAKSKVNFSVFPNPLKGELLTISCNYPKVDFQIYNSLGQQVASGISMNGHLNVITELWPQGIYFVVGKTNESVLVQKVIKQ